MPRAFFHDYHSRCIYHITMTKASGAPLFSSLTGGIENTKVVLTPLGEVIQTAIYELPKRQPALKILQYIIMPDHIHMLIFVTERIPKALGSYISMLKIISRQLYRDLTGNDITIFNTDYYDCILHSSRNLDTIFSYIRSNPYRLAVRRAHPDFFRKVYGIQIGGHTYTAYGNIQLLDDPFKRQVVIHRADSPEEKKLKRAEWLHAAANGGVLVSPFISPEEKAVRAQAESLGGRIILIVHEAFGERFKPAAHDFELCCAGILLIISLGLAAPTELSRSMCMLMNSLASQLAEEDYWS